MMESLTRRARACVCIVCAAWVILATPRLCEGVGVAEVEEVNACALQSDKRGERGASGMQGQLSSSARETEGEPETFGG